MTIIWSGLALGAIYTIIALQYNIVFVASGVFNFAQAQIAVTGTFFVYFLATTAHIPAAAVVVLSALGCAALAVIEEFFAVRPLQGRGYHGELVTTLGAAVVLEGAALVLWGPNPEPVQFPGPQAPQTILGGRVLPFQLVLIALSIIIALGLRVAMRRTMFGVAALATAENRSAAMLRGVNTRLLSVLFFACAGALAGATAIVIGPQTFALYDGGNSLVLLAFLALAIGGFGSQIGALVGGLAAGLIQSLSLRYLGTNYATLVLFGVLLTVLLLRPRGLFGTTAVRNV
ncbi:MAG TPA: branched-chain amino acid ABC transporter permease [Acidimicrobiales bacterium]|nr:branched-chain amino acid ABC transporter permease [Acidimicrobiales bacterium]